MGRQKYVRAGQLLNAALLSFCVFIAASWATHEQVPVELKNFTKFPVDIQVYVIDFLDSVNDAKSFRAASKQSAIVYSKTRFARKYVTTINQDNVADFIDFALYEVHTKGSKRKKSFVAAISQLGKSIVRKKRKGSFPQYLFNHIRFKELAFNEKLISALSVTPWIKELLAVDTTETGLLLKKLPSLIWLETLTLQRNQLDKYDLTALVECTGLKRLTIKQNHLQDKISVLRNLEKLVILDISGNKLSDKHIAELQGLKRLRELKLDYNGNITGDGILNLKDLGIQKLSLVDTIRDSRSIPSIAKSLLSLKEVTFGVMAASYEDLNKAKKYRPELIINTGACRIQSSDAFSQLIKTE